MSKPKVKDSWRKLGMDLAEVQEKMHKGNLLWILFRNIVMAWIPAVGPYWLACLIKPLEECGHRAQHLRALERKRHAL